MYWVVTRLSLFTYEHVLLIPVTSLKALTKDSGCLTSDNVPDDAGFVQNFKPGKKTWFLCKNLCSGSLKHYSVLVRYVLY